MNDDEWAKIERTVKEARDGMTDAERAEEQAGIERNADVPRTDRRDHGHAGLGLLVNHGDRAVWSGAAIRPRLFMSNSFVNNIGKELAKYRCSIAL